MKTYKNLYPRIYDFQNLYAAYLKARRGKRYQQEVLCFSANLEEELIALQNELIWKTYRTGPYRYFYVHDPKKRLVAALPFRDRVVHHALCNVIEPIFEKRFIADSFACRVGKGTHRGADRVTEFLRSAQRMWGMVFCLKGDVAQYFASVNHHILMGILARTIACRDTLWLMKEILASGAAPDDPDPVGIPIGNLTSQLWANVYLNELDQFVKHVLRARFYVRYMDDFILLAGDKPTLWGWRREIEGFLEANLRLRLNSKTDIFPISRGIDFLGYRIWPTHRLLRKASVKRMRRALKKFQKLYREGRIGFDRINATVQSWLGHAKHANTYSLRKKILGSVTFSRSQEEVGPHG